MLIRVRKQDVRNDEFIEQSDALDMCLDCWKVWMTDDPDRDLGVKNLRLLVGNSDGHGSDPDEAQHARDSRIGAATDAMIDSLTQIHRWAVYKLCSIATPWRFPNADILIVGPEALASLRIKLKNNVCTGVMF